MKNWQRSDNSGDKGGMSRLSTDGRRNVKIGLEFWNRIRNIDLELLSVHYKCWTSNQLRKHNCNSSLKGKTPKLFVCWSEGEFWSISGV